jgi:hypothetical protein
MKVRGEALDEGEFAIAWTGYVRLAAEISRSE